MKPVTMEGADDSSVVCIFDTMEKPLLDDRSYRVIELRNHLEALLIHDPTTNKAAAALDVNAGSFCDPEDMPGTAHAVEHFCFMGTKKFPGENEYNTYLNRYGGSSNAYTSPTSTNYYFEIAASSSGDANIGKDKAPLYGALERFSQFFIEPLFLADALDRELRAVDSENKKNLQNDQWRLHQLSRTLSSRESPFHKFPSGNYQSLREVPVSLGIDIRARFIDFYKAHYSANRMKLVVLGRESLQELESWIKELFSDVPNKNLPRLRWDMPAFGDAELMTQVFIKPVMEQRLCNIDFVYPDEEELFASRPGRYLAHLIGHEGPGSILAYLKELGLAESLSSGISSQCPGLAFFCLDVRLTEKGMSQCRDVLRIIFQYIAMLRERPPLARISDEMARLAEVEFKFGQKGRPAQTVSGLAQTMQNPHIPRELLLSPYLIRKFDPAAIEHGLSYLCPENFRAFIIDPNASTNEKEKWYGTEYRCEKISDDLKQDILAATKASAAERPSQLHLPAVNEFVPQRLDVERIDVGEASRYPMLIRRDEFCRVWFKKDDQFWVPKANVKLLLRSPVASITPLNAVMTRLVVELVEDSLGAYAYNAEIAGLRYGISESPQGLIIECSGFSDKMVVLLEKVMLEIRNLKIEQKAFDVAKERVRKVYKNFDYIDPHRQVSTISRMLMKEKSWAPFELLKQLPSVTAEDVGSFIYQLLRQMHFEILVHGNLRREEALDVARIAEFTLGVAFPLPESQWPSRRAIMLPGGADYRYQRALQSPDNVNHCLDYTISVGCLSDRIQRAKLLLFAQIVQEPCFDTLRTREQLGYIVNSSIGVQATEGTWRILIQSERDCEYLEQRCDAFLASFAQKLRAITSETFEEHKVALINRRLEKEKNLGQETQRFWTHITNETFDFEQGYRDAEHIRSLTKDDLLAFFDQRMHPSSPTRAKLSIHLVAKTSTRRPVNKDAEAMESDMTVDGGESWNSSAKLPATIGDVRSWKNSLPLTTAASPVRCLSEFEEVDYRAS